MNSTHGITAENLLCALPVALQDDKNVQSLAASAAEALARRPEEIARLMLYPAIDTLPEPLLDILAYDFKVDWWNPNYTPEEKRRTLKDSWRIHRILGTKAAVEMAIRAVYSKTQVLEWFEYEGGKPYHFKLNIDLSDIQCDETKPWAVLERVDYYKSLRSHLEEIIFVMHTDPSTLHIGGGMGALDSIGVPIEPDVYDYRKTVYVGGGVGVNASVGTAAKEDELNARTSVCVGGTAGIHTVHSLPEDISPPSTTTILRSGGVCTILSNLPPGGRE